MDLLVVDLHCAQRREDRQFLFYIIRLGVFKQVNQNLLSYALVLQQRLANGLFVDLAFLKGFQQGGDYIVFHDFHFPQRDTGDSPYLPINILEELNQHLNGSYICFVFEFA